MKTTIMILLILNSLICLGQDRPDTIYYNGERVGIGNGGHGAALHIYSGSGSSFPVPPGHSLSEIRMIADTFTSYKIRKVYTYDTIPVIMLVSDTSQLERDRRISIEDAKERELMKDTSHIYVFELSRDKFIYT